MNQFNTELFITFSHIIYMWLEKGIWHCVVASSENQIDDHEQRK